jgi:hypothetical protein
MSLLNPLKLFALRSALESLSVKEIVDVIDSFGEKEFGKEKDKYLDQIRTKLANIVFEIGKRIRKVV